MNRHTTPPTTQLQVEKDTLPPQQSTFSGLRETVEVLMDRNMVEMIQQSQSEIQNGEVQPLTDLLEDRLSLQR